MQPVLFCFVCLRQQTAEKNYKKRMQNWELAPFLAPPCPSEAAMPTAQQVELSDEDSDAGGPTEPAAKRRRIAAKVPPKLKLTSEMHLRVLVGARCQSCKSRCLTAFQAPAAFRALQQFRSEWAQTHKLDQDIIVPRCQKVFISRFFKSTIANFPE